MKIEWEVAPNLTPRQKKLVEKMQREAEEDFRLFEEGKFKPYPKHLQAKMDSGGPFADEIHDAPPAKPKPGKKG